MQIEEFNYAEEMNVLPSILWQYEQAANLKGLVLAKQTWLDANFTGFWLNYQNNIFDLATANPTLFQMSVWCIILNVPLLVNIKDEAGKPIWGFNHIVSGTPPTAVLENSYKNFGDTLSANPGSGNFSIQNGYVLTLQEQQFLLRLRYFDLCNLGDINDINSFLNYICTNNTIGYTGTIYVVDNLDMTITYTFTTTDFPVSLLAVLKSLDLLPRPVGVSTT